MMVIDRAGGRTGGDGSSPEGGDGNSPKGGDGSSPEGGDGSLPEGGARATWGLGGGRGETI